MKLVITLFCKSKSVIKAKFLYCVYLHVVWALKNLPALLNKASKAYSKSVYLNWKTEQKARNFCMHHRYSSWLADTLYVGKLTNLILKDKPEIYDFFTVTTINSIVHLQPKNMVC